MCKFLISVLLIIYIIEIAKRLHSLIEVCNCLKKLNNFSEAYKRKNHLVFSNSDTYMKQLNSLLNYSPVISKYCTYSSLSLSRTNDDYVNNENAMKYYKIFLDIKDLKCYELKCAFNPIVAIQSTLIFPVTILRWIGFNPQKISALFLSIIGWTITYLLNTFQDEIKAGLIYLLQYFIHA